MSRDNISHVVTLTHSKRAGARHDLTGDLGNSAIVLAMFKATEKWSTGDSGFWLNNDTTYTMANTPSFSNGDVVMLTIDTVSKKLTFKQGGSGGNETKYSMASGTYIFGGTTPKISCGFKPLYIMIRSSSNSDTSFAYTYTPDDQYGAAAVYHNGGASNSAIAISNDGFTVDDRVASTSLDGYFSGHTVEWYAFGVKA